MSSSEEKIIELFGTSIKNIDLSYFNMNCNPIYGKEKSDLPSCGDYIIHALNTYPSLIGAYSNKKEKQSTSTQLDIANEIFTPVWVSPHSTVKLVHPVAFGGDHRTEDAFKHLMAYSTQQLFAKYTNGNVAAVLSHKLKYNSADLNGNESVIKNTNVGKDEIDYALERGMLYADKDKNIIPDFIRFIAYYKRSNEKLGVSIIGGDHAFVDGYTSIMPLLITYIKNIWTQIKNDHYNGIFLSKCPIGKLKNNHIDKLQSDVEYNSIGIARYIAGSILVHDHLMMLKHIYGVCNILQYDLTEEKSLHKVSIDTAINLYRPIKDYYVMAQALNQIK